MKKKTLFKFIALSLPLVLIFIVEIILRFAGYGDNYNLFNKVTSENKTEYLVMNSKLSKKYFKDNEFKSDNQSDLFLKNKTDNTFRVFVQGASTVVGYPFYSSASFPRLLKHRLSQTFPEKNIEIVNTAITAVNSYTLWDIVDEIIDQQPDLIIIYAGHNEYYGALGVGSSASVGSHPRLIRTYLSLKDSRFFQLLDNTYTKIFNSKQDHKKNIKETTLMEVMAKEQEIALNSEVYNAGVEQYKSNIEKIITKYQKNDIPVILSTIVSNEKDIKPFISSDLEEEVFNEILKKNKSEVHKIAKTNAKAAYKLGQFYLNKQQDSAKKYFHLAKELDLLRFRAPEKINDVIVEIAQKKKVELVDMKKYFENFSTNGFLGDDLFTEHVHPNVEGYFVMADAFYNKIKELELIGDWYGFIPKDKAFNNLPVTLIDSIKGKMIVDDLKQSWPYKLKMSGKRPSSLSNLIEKPTFEELKAIGIYTGREMWENVMRQAYNRYEGEGDFEKALKVAQSLIFEFTEQPVVYEMAAEMCRKLKKNEEADFYQMKANKLK